MLTKIKGCSETDFACLCKNPDFTNGIHDCTVESCPTASAQEVIAVGTSFCGCTYQSSVSFNESRSQINVAVGDNSTDGSTTVTATTSGTSTLLLATGPGTTSTIAGVAGAGSTGTPFGMNSTTGGLGAGNSTGVGAGKLYYGWGRIERHYWRQQHLGRETAPLEATAPALLQPSPPQTAVATPLPRP